MQSKVWLKQTVLLASIILTVSCQEFCNKVGKCQGNSNFVITIDSYNECLAKCKDFPSCQFFTFFKEEKNCVSFNECNLDETCSTCISGERTCEIKSCHVQGYHCDGAFVQAVDAGSANECLALCKITDRCNWYSFFPSTNDCLMTEDCQMVTEGCNNCECGEGICPGPKETILVAAGGFGDASADVEAVNLGNDGLVCEKPIYFPMDRSFVGVFGGTKMILCGGGNSEIINSDECLSYDKDMQAWNFEFRMTTPRKDATGVLMSDSQFLILGGFNGSSWQKSTEICDFGKKICSPYVTMPEAPDSSHNFEVVKANSTHLVIIAGSVEQTWLFNIESEQFSQLPSMQTYRSGPGFGKYVNSNGEVEIIVAGGFMTSSEILNLKGMYWRPGPELPFPISRPGSVQYEDSFLMVGGNAAGLGSLDTIIKYDVESNQWQELPEKLQTARSSNIAFLAPPFGLSCHF